MLLFSSGSLRTWALRPGLLGALLLRTRPSLLSRALVGSLRPSLLRLAVILTALLRLLVILLTSLLRLLVILLTALLRLLVILLTALLWLLVVLLTALLGLLVILLTALLRLLVILLTALLRLLVVLLTALLGLLVVLLTALLGLLIIPQAALLRLSVILPGKLSVLRGLLTRLAGGYVHCAFVVCVGRLAAVSVFISVRHFALLSKKATCTGALRRRSFGFTVSLCSRRCMSGSSTLRCRSA